MNCEIKLKSVRFRTGDWEHCFLCKAEEKAVDASHEMCLPESFWIPCCEEHLLRSMQLDDKVMGRKKGKQT